MSDSNQDAQLELTILDRGFGPISPMLYDMPIEIVNHVLEKLEPIDRVRIRKVCRNLRTCVDRFGIRFDNIIFYLRENLFELVLDGIYIRYIDADNGSSTVKYANKRKVIKGANPMKVALQDLKTLLNHTSELTIYNYLINQYENMTSFMEVLKSKKCIHVKRITLHKFSFNGVVTILQYFDTEILEEIILWDTDIKDQFENITCLDKCNCAKTLYLRDSVLESEQILHLFSFQYFYIELDGFPTYIAIKIRDDLMRRRTFQNCEIHFNKLKSNPIEIAKVFKPDYDGDNDFSIEYLSNNANFEIKCILLNDSILWFFAQKL